MFLNGYRRGLFYDLKDSRNETGNPVLDQVSGYTNQQMFNSFKSGVTKLQDYKKSLLQTATNPTSTFVNSLFSQYGY